MLTQGIDKQTSNGYSVDHQEKTRPGLSEFTQGRVHGAPDAGGWCSAKIAIVHDWLPLRGAERVLEQILQLCPGADLFTLMESLPKDQRGFIMDKPVQTSFIQNLPFSRKSYRSYFPLMPLAIEQMDVTGYDIVISSSYAFAKGVITGPDQLHVCFCHSPIRYAWDMQHHYLAKAAGRNPLVNWIVRILLHYIRQWDVRTSNGVDSFIANSKYIGRRIHKAYRRDSTVVYPPVNIDSFPLCRAKEGFYLTASRMGPYKSIDLIMDAFQGMPDKELVVIGDGPEFKKIQAKARRNIKVMGYQPFDASESMQRARAFVFAAEEDFGIAPVEAQACGTPVIAYGRGGVMETVIDGETGMFFPEHTAASIQRAVHDFEFMAPKFDPDRIRANAERFGVKRFRTEFAACMEKEWANFKLSNSRLEQADYEVILNRAISG